MGIGYEYIFLPDVNTYVFRLGTSVALFFLPLFQPGDSPCALAGASSQSIVLRYPPRITLMLYYDNTILLCTIRYYYCVRYITMFVPSLPKTNGIQPLDDDEFPVVGFLSARRRGHNPRLGISHIFNANR